MDDLQELVHRLTKINVDLDMGVTRRKAETENILSRFRGGDVQPDDVDQLVSTMAYNDKMIEYAILAKKSNSARLREVRASVRLAN